jgi:hypothetical protein
MNNEAELSGDNTFVYLLKFNVFKYFITSLVFVEGVNMATLRNVEDMFYLISR